MKIIIIIILLAFIILALSFLLTFIMYRMQFGKRIDICEADKKSDIPRRKKIEFYSGKNKLTGYFYGINQNKVNNKVVLLVNGYGVTLTPTGRLLYYYGRSILEQFQVLEKLKNLSEESIYSKLAVSVDSIFLRDDLILQFYNHIRSADTEIKMIETTAEEVLNNVSDMTSEIGIVILNNYQLAIFKKMTELKDVEMIVLGTGPLYVHIQAGGLGTYSFRKGDCIINIIPIWSFGNAG